jgi:hypothetical protein
LDLLNERQAVRFSRNPAQLKDEILQNSPDSHTKEGFVVIDEVDTDNWGVAGESVSTIRNRQRIGT